ncbi:MAG TPA: DUF4159 domain-containing protein [Blastocatellia bacterium]|jgi:hypothetical protein|nr:DUF4159 domain-containing protein [Blastocatellia bacterium]
MKATAFALLLGCLLLLSSSAQSQLTPRRSDFTDWRRSGESPRQLEYTFARLEYRSYGRRWSRWATDYPEADYHFIMGLRNWCRSSLAISDEPISFPPDDKEIFKYPFVYVVEPGYMELSTQDAANLREYLTRGGFMVLDDFWGTYEWQNVEEQMRRIFPEYQIQELPLDHPVFHCYFDIDEVVQVPQVGYIWSGITYERDGYVPHYEGIMDDTGRIMVFIARNADNGDAWEHIDNPQYPLKFGLAAYRLGMNLIVYSMTH